VSERARALTHGDVVRVRLTAKEVLKPVHCNKLLQELIDAKEGMYHRKEHQPLGCATPAHRAELPPFTKDEEFRFGDKSLKGEGAKSLISPAVVTKAEGPVTGQKSAIFRSLQPGERRRVYGDEWTTPSRHAPARSKEGSDGHRVQEALFWEDERQNELHSKVVSSRLATFRAKTHRELGKVHDPYVI
jgi:hypothetical protein